MYLVDWWCFSIFENWSYVGNGLEGAAMHSTLVTELYDWGAPCSLGKAAAMVFILSFTGHLSRGVGLDYTTSLLSLPVLCFLLHIFSWRSCLLLFSHLVMSNFFAIPWIAACQTSLSLRLSWQQSWSGLPFPTPGDILDQGIEPMSPSLQLDSLPLRHEASPSL